MPKLVLTIFGATLGKNVRINRWLTIHEAQNDFSKLTVGNDVHIGKHAFLDLTAEVVIGDRVAVGMYSRLLTHENVGDSRLREAAYPIRHGMLMVPDDCAIAVGSIILYPTTLQPGTIVSGGSVVRGQYERPGVIVGNPGRMVRSLEI